jgi:hypothetical protein
MPRLGLKLGDITDLLAVRDTGVCPCEPAADLLHRRLTELDAEPTEQIRVHCGMTEPDDWRWLSPH